MPAQSPLAPNAPRLLTGGIRVLHCVSLRRSGGRIGDALVGEAPGGVQVEEVVGVTATMARLREEGFDAVVASHEPEAVDALELVAGLRASGGDEAVVILGDEPSPDLELLCYEAWADVFCCVAHATARSLLGALERAIDRRRLLRDHRQSQERERQRLEAEHRDAEQTLAEQRRLVSELEQIGRREPGAEPVLGPPPQQPYDLPAEFVGQYRDVLRASVMMGSGNLSREVATFAELLVGAGVSADRVMHTHLLTVEGLLSGLGRRSARHVLHRAELLLVELVAKLADGYRRRYHERAEPPRQQTLPGFDPPADPPTLHAPLGDDTAEPRAA